MGKIKIALVGYGYWGKILEKYLLVDNVFELKYILETGKQSIINKLIINDINIILKDPSIKIVFLATPINTHYELCKLFLANYKHVVCEKPLTKNSKEIIELQEVALKNNVKLETNYIYLYSLAIQKMKKLLKKIGDIKYVDAEITQYGNFYKEDDVYSVIGCHLFSVIIDFFGTNFDIFKYDLYKNKEGIVYIGNVKLQYNNFVANINLSLKSFFKRRRITIYGNKGILEYDMLNENPLVFYTIDGNEIVKIQKYKFNEKDNILNMLIKIKELCSSNINSNISLSKDVSFVLEKLGEKNEQ